MEEFSRRALVALVVAAAGPGAALLTVLLVAPTLIASSVPETDGGVVELVGSGLVGVLVGGLLSAVVAYVVAAGATLLALRATGCPRPQLAWILCLVLSPVWMSLLGTLDLDLAGFLVLCGVLPGAVRLGFDHVELPVRRTADLVPPPSEPR